MNEPAQLTFTHIATSELTPGPWKATYVLKPDKDVMLRSMEEFGLLQPIVVQKSTNRVIDGHARVDCALHIGIRELPVVLRDLNDIDAMLLHLQLNRGRGQVMAKNMSRLIRDMLRSGQYEENDLRYKLVMKADEMDLMVDGSLIKMRKVPSHQYSKAWVPVEAPAKATEVLNFIERPPNADR